MSHHRWLVAISMKHMSKESFSAKPLILVTGGTGLVGSYLLRYLVRDGQAVRALRRPGSSTLLAGEADGQVEWVDGDLLDPGSLEDALEGVDTIIHAAALVSFSPNDRDALVRVNRDGTANLVNAALYQGVRRFIHLSSVAALGRKSGNASIDESTAWQFTPTLPRYSVSKFQAEREVWRGQAEGLWVAVVYPSLIFGSGWWTVGTNRMFSHVDRELPFYPPGANGVVDVRDVARAVMLLLHHGQDGDRYLLNGHNISYRDLMVQIAGALGRKAPHLPMQRWQARLLLIGEAIRSRLLQQPPLLTPETVRNSFQHFSYNNERSQRQLSLSYTPIEQTIRETAAQYLDAQQKQTAFDLLPLL